MPHSNQEAQGSIVTKVSRQYGHPLIASAMVADTACLSVSLHGERKKKSFFPQKETAPGLKGGEGIQLPSGKSAE